jgi:hypothetical protein
MAGMETVALWNFEASLLHYDWRYESLGRRYRERIRRLLRTPKVHHGKDQKKCEQYE